MIKLITFGVLCGAAIAAGLCTRQDRRCVTIAAATLTANWVLFAMPWVYNPASLAHLLKVAGFSARHEDMWALADVLSLFVIGWGCREHWWAGALIGPYIAMLAMHVVAYCAGMEYREYALLLDLAFAVQLAVIFMLGGDGVSDRLSACWCWGRRSMAHLPMLATHMVGGRR